jgi:DNA sulfur modification protein DndD
MKLLSMELENFRQYYGKQTIDFAAGENNVTIILGENGKGKTGIFRALMFALYNATHIEQDNSNEKIHLVNLQLVDDNPGSICKASVTVRFQHKGKKYEIYRSIAGVKRNNTIQERDGEVKLYEFDEDGNYSPDPAKDNLTVKNIMNQILDEDIKDFFLFDGEKIDTLAKTNAEVKKEVKTAIFNLLQIDNLEDATKLLNNLKNSEQRNVVKQTTDINVIRKQEELDQVSEELEQQEIILSETEKEASTCEVLIQKLELQLAQNKDIAQIQELLKAQKATKDSKAEYLEKIRNEIVGKVFLTMPYLLLNDAFNNVSNYLEGMIADNETNIPLDVIQESLNKEVCICCNNDLSVHKENMEFLRLLKQNYKLSKSDEFTKSILRMINKNRDTFADNKEEILDLLKEYNQKIRELRDAERQIDEINKEYGAKAKEQLNLDDTNLSLNKQKQQLNITNQRVGEIKARIEALRKRIDNLRNEFSRIIKQNKTNIFEQKVIDVIQSLLSDATMIAKEFSGEMREKLKETTTSIFKTLIDHKDVGLIKEININEKFELEIISSEDIEITQDISQGQRQIVALSFITALAQVAAGDNEKIAFPLFMDSPFNRLSGVNRDQLIVNIPELTSQWILLLTDTELTTSEELVFKKEQRLGKWYRINQVAPYRSEIEEVSLHDTLTTRGI